MELDNDTLDAYWTKDTNGKPEFFIINEAIISKLCILGENYEPCFEGAQITKVQFSLDNEFKQTLFSMISDLTKLLNEGGESMFNRYAIEIGDSLWSTIWSYVWATYPDKDCGSLYNIDGVFEDNGQKFAILQNRKDMKYYRLDFSLNEESGFEATGNLVEVTKSYTPAATPQFDPSAVAAYEENYKKQKEDEEKKPEDKGDEPKEDGDGEKTDDKKETEDDDTSEEDEEDKKKKAKYSLDEIPEYQELLNKYNKLTDDYKALETEKNSLNENLESLVNFKKNIERKEKEAMIDSFYMLSEADKKDCIDNIDTYSLNDIEAKLSIICVRNKVNFNLEDEVKDTENPTTYNLIDSEADDTPAWIKAVRAVQNNLD